MKKFGLMTLGCMLLAGIALWLSPAHRSAEAVMPVEAPTAVQGEWVVSEHAIANVSDLEFAGATVVIGTAPQVTITDINGAEELLQFQSSQQNPNGVFETLASMADDDAMMGGGGSRKAICRVDGNGDLEILETLSADEGYPADFSGTSKANGIYWKLTPVE